MVGLRVVRAAGTPAAQVEPSGAALPHRRGHLAAAVPPYEWREYCRSQLPLGCTVHVFDVTMRVLECMRVSDGMRHHAYGARAARFAAYNGFVGEHGLQHGLLDEAELQMLSMLGDGKRALPPLLPSLLPQPYLSRCATETTERES